MLVVHASLLNDFLAARESLLLAYQRVAPLRSAVGETKTIEIAV